MAKDVPEPAPMGRPPIYRPEFCEVIIGLGKRGYSQARMAAHLDVAKSTITEWSQQHADFANALSRARTYSQAWWEQRAQEGLEDRDFNAGIWDRSVKSMFREDYVDRVETSGSVTVSWKAAE